MVNGNPKSESSVSIIPLAVLVVGISMVSFLLLYWQAGSPAPLRKIAQVDLLGLPVLAGVAWLAFRQ